MGGTWQKLIGLNDKKTLTSFIASRVASRRACSAAWRSSCSARATSSSISLFSSTTLLLKKSNLLCRAVQLLKDTMLSNPN
jgi:hypothetical protein